MQPGLGRRYQGEGRPRERAGCSWPRGEGGRRDAKRRLPDGNRAGRSLCLNRDLALAGWRGVGVSLSSGLRSDEEKPASVPPVLS